MAGEIRKRMVDGAVSLLARRGLQATSFSEVLAETGAPRGSLYHHFPGGKDQLVAEAVDAAGQLLVDALDAVAGQPAEAVVQRFFAIWTAVLTRSRFEAGCAVLAVTVAANSTDLLGQATQVFRGWREHLAELLVQGGLPRAAAEPLALAMIASAEGAVVLARAEQSLAPLEAVAGLVLDQVRRAAGGAPA